MASSTVSTSSAYSRLASFTTVLRFDLTLSKAFWNVSRAPRSTFTSVRAATEDRRASTLEQTAGVSSSPDPDPQPASVATSTTSAAAHQRRKRATMRFMTVTLPCAAASSLLRGG